MKEVKNRKQNPTAEESQVALEAQMPPARIQHESADEVQPTKLQRVSTFKQLAAVSRSARLAFGSAMNWVKPAMLFNEAYRLGLESPPFFITKAFKFKSKEIPGDRLGIEIVLSNGKSYNVSLGLNENDSVRMGIYQMFQQPNAEPVGPFSMTRLPTDKGNDYWNITPYQPQDIPGPDVDVPFVEIDEEMPF
jgi:hypothetical protein